jgi:hypothetical protein
VSGATTLNVNAVNDTLAEPRRLSIVETLTSFVSRKEPDDTEGVEISTEGKATEIVKPCVKSLIEQLESSVKAAKRENSDFFIIEL